MFVSYTANGRAGSMAYFCTDTKRAYYVFGANDPDLRDEHTGTAVLWDAFKSLAMTGVSEVDMEGINSPKRGWFKLSFGGEIVPYYNATFKREGQ
jgi:lipid II:glycine glycyltransferase (peptidoglycan interpeptide bridge formation enzyme)